MDIVAAASAKATHKAINPQQGEENKSLLRAASKQAALQRAANASRQAEFYRLRRVHFLRKLQAFACFLCITIVFVVLVGVFSSGDWAKRDVAVSGATNSSGLDVIGLVDGSADVESISPFFGYCFCKTLSSARCADVGNAFGGLSVLCIGLLLCEFISLGLLLWEAAFYGRFGGSVTLANLVTIFLLMSLATSALSLSAVYMLLTYSFCKGQPYKDLLVRPGTAVFIRVVETLFLFVICVYAAARSGARIKTRSADKGASSRHHGGPRGLLLVLLLLLIPTTLNSTLSMDWLFYDPSVAEEVRYGLSGTTLTAPYQMRPSAAINGAVRRFGIRSTCQCSHPCAQEVETASEDSVDVGAAISAWWPGAFYTAKTRSEVKEYVGASSLFTFSSLKFGVPSTASEFASMATWSTKATISYDETVPVAPHLARGSISRRLYEQSSSFSLSSGATTTSGGISPDTTLSAKMTSFGHLVQTMFMGAPVAVVAGSLAFTTFPAGTDLNGTSSYETLVSASWRPHFMFLWILVALQVVVALGATVIVVMRVVDNEGRSVVISQVLGGILLGLMVVTLLFNFIAGPPSTEVTCPAYGTFDPAGKAAATVATWEAQQSVYGQYNGTAVTPVVTKSFTGSAASYALAGGTGLVAVFLILNGMYLAKERLGYHDVGYPRRRYHSWWWEVLQDPRTMAVEERQITQLEGDSSSDDDGASDEDNGD